MSELRFQANRCAGHALCNATAPEVYELDDSGYLLAPPTMVVDAELVSAAEAGARACPEGAISVAADRVVTH